MRGWNGNQGRGLLSVAGLALAATAAHGQIIDDTAMANIAGMEIRCVGSIFSCQFLNQYRDSFVNPLPIGQPNGIVPAAGYQYRIEGTVVSSGLLADFVPSGSSFADLLELFDPGQSILVEGYTRNLIGGLPDPKNSIFLQRFDGEFFNLSIGITLQVSISDQGAVAFEMRNINIPLGSLIGSIRVDQGSLTVETWTPSAIQETEWRMNGDFTPAFGNSSLRYMDDPAFGTILRDSGSGDVPDPTIPTGVTQAQSSFASTTSLGIPGPGGDEAMVYVTSPARNLSNPSNGDWARPIGLSLFPGTRPDFPGGFIGQWSMVMDIYIPQAAWDAPTGGGFVAALIQDNHNNEDEADLFIRNPTFGGGGNIGYGVEPAQYISTPLIAPERWMRVAYVSDLMQTGTGYLYIDGQFIGTTGADWLYNITDPTSPAYADGQPVDPADWAAWGQHPSPWAISSADAPMKSTFSLFSDGLLGRSESVYLANLYWADTALNDAEVADLGGANAAGIKLDTSVPCLGDIADDFGFTAADGGGPDGVVDFGDFVALLGLIGPCDGGTPGCLGDIADDFGFTAVEGGGPDGVVDFGDFVALLGLIGPCSD